MPEKPIAHRAGPRLAGKVAVVTGGGKGIGSATAQVLAAEGAQVVVATRTAEPGQATVDAIRAHIGEAADVRGVLAELQADYAGRGIALVRRGERWHFETAADMAHLLRRDREEPRKLSRVFVIAFGEKQRRPKNDESNAHSYLVVGGFGILDTGRSGGALRDALRFLGQLRTGVIFVCDW